uniref:Uncharacterized protein n=1 Tax=Rhizophora mucronata TaxID=61149 RepID=A0A2P2J7Q2_RHIMU
MEQFPKVNLCTSMGKRLWLFLPMIAYNADLTMTLDSVLIVADCELHL